MTRAPAGVVFAMALTLSSISARRVSGQISPGPLAQPHAQLEGVRNCTQCHGTRKEEMTTHCLACHRDIAWLIDSGRGYHATVTAQRCAACHPDHAGRDLALITWPGGDSGRFDHTKTGWPLEGAHAKVRCETCHRPALRITPVAALSQRRPGTGGWTGLDRRCASCHADPHRGTLSGACTDCHQLTAWKPATGFDHDSTAYELTGRHRDVACDQCHRGLTAAVAKAGAPAVPAVFGPLPHAECSNCHRDPHGGRLGATCARCHSTAGFTSFTTATFDHERTRYPLRGAHLSVRCDQCHDFRAGATQRDRPFATCGGCHTDPHAGSATLAGKVVDCAGCHTVSGFTPATYTVAQHATTRFALAGRHQTVACASCHIREPDRTKRVALGSAGVRMRPPLQCVGCHVDPHQGHEDRIGACTTCHTLTAFRPSTVDAAAHTGYAFALTGAHRAVPCAACHRDLARPGTRPLLFANGSSCRDCHADPHGGQFADTTGGHAVKACVDCHNTDAFTPAQFDHARDAQFSLSGGHAVVTCAACHRNGNGPGGRPAARYRGTPRACEACHTSTPRKGT